MKIALLLSGGVDSAVALKLLKEQGHEVHAFYLKIWMEDELSHLSDCPWKEDINFVQKICTKEAVPLEIIPMQHEYFDNIVKYIIKEVKAGATPNPDVLCNNHIKFGLFFKKISKDFDRIASGHYAQTIEREGSPHLKRSPDPVKDQTYFLSRLKPAQLKRIIFPIGHLKKSELRALAEKFDLPNKNRKDSQGICFLGKIKYRDFLSHYLPETPGELVEFESKKVLGVHSGYWRYTIGQRKDIRLADGPWFVVSKDIRKNIIFVSKKYYEPECSRDTFSVKDLNWFAGHAPSKKNLRVKIRHGENEYKCTITEQKNKLKVKIFGNDQGIAKGQFAAFYDKDICLGAGIIC